mmetsp:Transcript_76516/g.211346  ORF Transcript_76516/g.211346 Transcript_76516/m.211346 type:complete len:218 (+) Transcript_76516:142-795(+)
MTHAPTLVSKLVDGGASAAAVKSPSWSLKLRLSSGSVGVGLKLLASASSGSCAESCWTRPSTVPATSRKRAKSVPEARPSMSALSRASNAAWERCWRLFPDSSGLSDGQGAACECCGGLAPGSRRLSSEKSGARRKGRRRPMPSPSSSAYLASPRSACCCKASRRPSVSSRTLATTASVASSKRCLKLASSASLRSAATCCFSPLRRPQASKARSVQ